MAPRWISPRSFLLQEISKISSPDPNVDLVDLCVPNDSHAPMAIQRLQAGKHVLVEKPIALSTESADEMLEAARTAGKLLMVGHVLPFFPEFAFALDAVQSDRHGTSGRSSFPRDLQARLVQRDRRCRPQRRAGRSICTSMTPTSSDFHAACPCAVHSTGVVEADAVVHLTTQYLYDRSDLTVSLRPPAHCASRAGPSHMALSSTSSAAPLAFEFANLAGEGHPAMPLSVILPDGSVERPNLGSGDPIDSFAQELTVAARSSRNRSGGRSALRSSRAQALNICLAEIDSVRPNARSKLRDC